jgi:hypothetical protein
VVTFQQTVRYARTPTETNPFDVSPLRQSLLRQSRGQRALTKRVWHGEPFRVAESLPTLWLTHGAESESSRGFVFSAHLATLCVVSQCGESSLRTGASATSCLTSPSLGSDSLALCLRRRFGLTIWFGSDPERNPPRTTPVSIGVSAEARSRYEPVSQIQDRANAAVLCKRRGRRR